jgi:hypothetical protein
LQQYCAAQAVLGLVLSLVVALTSHATATQAHASGFPIKGKVVPGKSIGAVSLGLTEAEVRARWGRNFTLCKSCTQLTWLYTYRGGEPLGAAVKFVNNKVVAVFTLGSPAGWGLTGIEMGDPVSNVYNLFGNTGTAQCIGYDALYVRIGTSTTAFYSAAGVIYGYALTAPTQSVCQ